MPTLMHTANDLMQDLFLSPNTVALGGRLLRRQSKLSPDAMIACIWIAIKFYESVIPFLTELTTYDAVLDLDINVKRVLKEERAILFHCMKHVARRPRIAHLDKLSYRGRKTQFALACMACHPGLLTLYSNEEWQGMLQAFHDQRLVHPVLQMIAHWIPRRAARPKLWKAFFPLRLE